MKKFLARRKTITLLVFVLTIATISLRRRRVVETERDSTFDDMRDLAEKKYKPREVIIMPGEEVVGISRHEALDDFSKHKYIEIYEDRNSSARRKVRRLELTNTTRDSGPLCTPMRCNKGVCFENMLCYKLPKLLPNFKNPCFYEEVCILSSTKVGIG